MGRKVKASMLSYSSVYAKSSSGWCRFEYPKERGILKAIIITRD